MMMRNNFRSVNRTRFQDNRDQPLYLSVRLIDRVGFRSFRFGRIRGPHKFVPILVTFWSTFNE